MYPTYGVPTYSVPTYSDPLAPSSIVYEADVVFTTDDVTFSATAGFDVDGDVVFTTDSVSITSTAGFDVDGDVVFTTDDITFASDGGGAGISAIGSFTAEDITFSATAGFDVDGDVVFTTGDITFASTGSGLGIAGNVSLSIADITFAAQAGFSVNADGNFTTDDIVFEALAGSASGLVDFTTDSIQFKAANFRFIPSLTDMELHEKLIQWVALKTGLTVIKPWQSGPKPAKPYLMVNFINSRQIRQWEQFIDYEVLDTLNISGKNEIFARPVTEIEWEYSVHLFGEGPTEELRRLRSISLMAQSNEPLPPTIMIHEIGTIKNFAIFENEAWEPRAQCMVRLRGTINDGEIIDIIEDASVIANRL